MSCFRLSEQDSVPCQHCRVFIRNDEYAFPRRERQLMAQADTSDKKLFNKDRKDTKDPVPLRVTRGAAVLEEKLSVFTVQLFPREE